MKTRHNPNMPLRIVATVIHAVLAGNVSIHASTEDATAASFDDCCEAHGGIDYQEGNLIVCNDGHICIVRA